MPVTVTNKVLKRELRAAGWETSDPVWWRPGRGSAYRRFTADDAAELRERFRRSHRESVLGAS
jgi:fatty-acyl-CoA synthase